MITCLKRLFHRKSKPDDIDLLYKSRNQAADERKKILDVCVDLMETYRRIDRKLEDRVVALEKAMQATPRI